MTEVSVPLGAPGLTIGEAIGTPCSSCTTQGCCRFLPLHNFQVTNVMELDYVRYLLGFASIEVGLGQDGNWGAYYRQPCSHLDEKGQCDVHGTAAKPHICVQYNPYSCWYRKVLSVENHPEHIRMDIGRFEAITEHIVLDEARQIVNWPTWEQLLAIAESVPLDDTVVPAKTNGAFVRWRTAAERREPTAETPAATSHGFHDQAVQSPCTGCAAQCCTKLTVPLDHPSAMSNLDFIRFALGYPGTELTIMDGVWQLVVDTTCRHFEKGKCSLYGKPERPLRCQFYDEWSCTYKKVFVDPPPPTAVRVTYAEIEALTDCFRFDDRGVATQIPDAPTVRAAIEASWAANVSG
jgi:hypothetical protein